MITITEKEYAKLKKAYDTITKAQKKYRDAHKDYYKEYHKKWQQENKEHLSQYQKQRRLDKKPVDITGDDGILETKGE